jgi:hypothetical protein
MPSKIFRMSEQGTAGRRKHVALIEQGTAGRRKHVALITSEI